MLAFLAGCADSNGTQNAGQGASASSASNASASHSLNGAGKVDACLKDAKSGEKQHIQATYTDGEELNTINGAGSYKTTSKYIVVDQFTDKPMIIDMGNFFKWPPLFPTHGFDQHGHEWVVEKYNDWWCR